VKLETSPAECGLPEEGDIPSERCKELCGSFEASSCRTMKRSEEGVLVFCHAAHPCLGRAPACVARQGRRARRRVGKDPIGAYLAKAERLEADSVHAFDELARDLERFGAPSRLVARCRVARDDEARHASAMRTLSDVWRRKSGGVDASPAHDERRHHGKAGARRRGFESLLRLALHNEREGVVGESWAALIARHQAEHASDVSVRRTMKTIATEETRHAAVSFAISAWARTVLDARGRASLDRARDGAVRKLFAATEPFDGDDDDKTLGWPTPARRSEMLNALGALWCAAQAQAV
jgi:hypothetical protein